LGGTFPRFFVLRLVDFFTKATCIPSSIPPLAESLKHGVTPITSPFDCALEAEKHRCLDGGGTCRIDTDGYYIVNVICIAVGVITFIGFIRPKALQLQQLPLTAWRLAGGGLGS
jgi:PAT family acetyl-CoA transporter-like MFS transporter 1